MRFGIGIHGEIHLIACKGTAQTMIVIQHRGDTIKAEAVEVENLHPVFQVGQQKVDHFVFAVVEKLGSPCAVVALFARMEELVGRTVKLSAHP